MDTKLILYIVKKGDSLESIAKSHNIPVSEIIRLNPLSKYRIIEGEPLKLYQNIKTNNNYRNEIKINEKTFSCYFNSLRLKILSSIFFSKGKAIYDNKYNQELNNLSIIKNNELLEKVIEKVCNLPTLFDVNNDYELINTQKEINTLVSKIKNNYPTYKHLNIDKMIESLELFILKLFSEDFSNAEEQYDIFKIEFINLFN